jgi:hemerythrin
MRELKWQDSYSVGVKKFDEQHQIIICQINKAFELFGSDFQTDQLKPILSELRNYAQVHFQNEEELLKKYKFHDLEGHKREHRLYENKIDDLLRNYDSGDEKVKVDLVEFLADWWMGHIQGCDMEYKRFLNNCGVF